MKIAVVGLGEVGSFYLRHWARAGHQPFVQDIAAAAARVVGQAEYIGPDGVKSWAEVVLFAPRFEHLDLAADAVGDIGNVVIIDPNNPFTPARDGAVDLGGRTAAHLVTSRFPGARVVKAFHNLGIATIQGAEGKLAALIASDDAAAATIAAQLAVEAGLVPVLTGDLASAKFSEFLGPLFGHPMEEVVARAAWRREAERAVPPSLS